MVIELINVAMWLLHANISDASRHCSIYMTRLKSACLTANSACGTHTHLCIMYATTKDVTKIPVQRPTLTHEQFQSNRWISPTKCWLLINLLLNRPSSTLTISSRISPSRISIVVWSGHMQGRFSGSEPVSCEGAQTGHERNFLFTNLLDVLWYIFT